MPASAIYVGRPTVYGNPFVVHRSTDTGRALYRVIDFTGRVGRKGILHVATNPRAASAVAVELHALHLAPGGRHTPDDLNAYLAPLWGRPLACWCSLTDRDGAPWPCHADTLLRLANPLLTGATP